jgi:uncharacterized repeat protein (TIGR02543 family)
VYTTDTTIHAQWTAIHTITFNPQGGTVSPTSAQTGAGGRLESLPTPTRTGWNFAGWFTDTTGDEQVTVDHVFSANSTIHARWSAVPIVVTFNANGGEVSPASATVGTNGQLANLPTPTREGFAFNGWFTEATGGETVSANHVYAANTVIFAQWSQIRTVTFNPQGGTFPEGTPTTAATGMFGRLTLTELPTPTRTGFTFDGWFTTATGSTRVTLDRVYSSDTSIHSQWTAIPVCSGDYNTCTIPECVLCLPLPCADCDKYPCECPDFCPECGEYPCNCPELCSVCERYPCVCVVVCPDCNEEVCVCQSQSTVLYVSEVNVAENWIEIKNDSESAVSARGVVLTDGENTWRLPAVIIRAGMTIRISGQNNNSAVALKHLTASFDFSSGTALHNMKVNISS